MNNEISGVNLVMQLVKDGIVVKNDLLRYLKNDESIPAPEKIRDEMEAWYRNMGIETL